MVVIWLWLAACTRVFVYGTQPAAGLHVGSDPPLWLPPGAGPTPGFSDRFASPDSLGQKNLSIGDRSGSWQKTRLGPDGSVKGR